MHAQLLTQMIDHLFLPGTFRGKPDYVRAFHRYVLELMEPVRVPLRAVLSTEGDVPGQLYFMLSGVAYGTYYTRDFPSQSFSPFLWPGRSIVGDGWAFLNGKPARFGVALQGAAMLYRLGREHLQLVMERYPETEKHVRWAIKQQNRQFEEWKDGLLHRSVRARLIRLLQHDADILGTVQQRHIAAHIGTSEQYCSTLLRKLAKENF